MSVYVENRIHNNLTECLPIYETNSKYGNLRVFVKQAIKQIAYWMERSKQRRALARLDDHMLEDIGYSHTEVQKEIAKPFWK